MAQELSTVETAMALHAGGFNGLSILLNLIRSPLLIPKRTHQILHLLSFISKMRSSNKQQHNNNKSKKSSQFRAYPGGMEGFRVNTTTTRPTDRLAPNLQTYPDTLNVPFRYADDIILTCTSGAAGQAQFRLNSLFDPDLTGIGNQPRYFDTMCGASSGNAPYSSYRVSRARVRVLIYCMNSSVTGFGHIYARVSKSSSLLSPTIDVSYYSEGPDIASTLVTNDQSSNNMAVFEFNVNIAKIFGSRNANAMDDLRAEYNANPVDVVFLEIGARPFDITTSTTYRGVVEIIYQTQLSGLNIPTLSLYDPISPVTVSSASSHNTNEEAVDTLTIAPVKPVAPPRMNGGLARSTNHVRR
jgi:hypothetical protein